MRYGTFCSGIEAPSVAWHSLGWQPQFFSEIEPFPSAVLSHHWPLVPNLGDMNQINGEELSGAVELICGGTPCQSFSVAGQRAGLGDPRGNLAVKFVELVSEIRPRWVLWENVPGVLSSNQGKDFEYFMNELENAGYVCDVDILDAQFFGVPQRRQRVFVCGQHRDNLLSQMTDSSALTIGQCLQEILQGILVETFGRSERGRGNSDSARHSKDGVMRRMKLFGLLGDTNNFRRLQANLIEAFRRCQAEQSLLVAPLGKEEKELMQEDLLMGLREDILFTLTEESLKSLLEEIYEVMKLFIISTETRTITTSQIFLCSQAVLSIARLIALLSPSCPSYWSAASSSLTALKEFTSYAREASRSLFTEMEWIQPWSDFVGEAEYFLEVVGCLGGWRCAAAVLFERNSLRRHSKASREAEQSDTRALKESSREGLLSFSLNAHGNRQDPTMETLIPVPAVLSLTERGRDGDRSLEFQQDKAYCLTSPGNGGRAQERVVCAPTLSTKNETASSSTTRQEWYETSALLTHSVRRLTPLECERLQGFPDGFTDIIFNGKKASDLHRYRATGNSMAVPVVRWIGERIELVDRILRENAA